MLKSLGKKFWDFCPKYNRKIVKSGFYVSRIFLWGNFFPEMTTHMFVLLGLRTKSFRTSIKRFSTIFKTAVYVSTDKFCGKIFFLQYRIVSKIFLPLFHESARRFSKLHLACSGEKFEIISFVLENKIFFVFILFFFRKFIGKPLETAFWVSRGPSSGEKVA